MDFGDWFASMCNKIGESPSTVAKNIGATPAAASYWFNNKKTPKKTTLVKLEEYFGEKFIESETDNKKSPAAEAAELDEDTMTILNLLGKLTPSNRDRAIAYLQGLVAGQS